MAHPLHWPGKYFFYPIGNTSAVCLTRDVDPSTPASILLLGCGDPRNVLYTIFSDSSSSPRKLDFTCCDFDPGVLARNVILLSLIIDNTPVNIIWDVFYHMYLDKESNTILVEKCRALAELAESDEVWRSSKYGPILKMCTTQTLKELRRYWLLYAEMDSLSPPHYQDIISTFKAHCASVLSMDVANLGPARSAGPFMTEAFSVAEIVFKNYWKTGTIFTDAKRISSATILNPTFVYSRGANACCIHYLLDPTAPFHLAAVYGNSKRPPSPADIAKAALSQFSTWCSTFQSALTTRPPESFPIIRFIWGDATSVCRSLHAFRSSRTLDIGIPVAQWRTQVNQLSREEYIISDAPSQFDVIHTSNLVDHIGLLNVIAVATPLLSSPASVLYTESLTYRGRDARRELYDLLFSDVTAFALLVDLCPVDYITGFSARSSSHELMAYEGFKGSPPQYQHILTWREPHSSDGVPGARKFDERQLGTFLYDVYHAMFEHEDSMNFFRKHSTNKDDFMRAVATSNVDHYTRESFVFLLKLIKDRIGTTNESWAGVMDWFFSIQTADKTMPMDMNNSHDLWTHLHRHGIYTVHWYLEKSPRIGPFSAWSTVPDLVRIILVVPREKLAVPGSIKDIGTPPMNCVVGGKWSSNIFSSVHVAFGRVIRMGTPNRPWVRFEEDPDGWTGSSSLVASFIMPSIVLTLLEPPTNINISLAFRSTAGSTIHLVPKLGLGLTVYSGSLMDQSHVHVVPEVQLSDSLTRSHATLHRQLLSNIGDCSVASVEFDDECELIKSLNVRVSVADKAATSLLQSGSTPSLVQISPCIIRISLGNQMQDVPYPFPVIGSQHKLRIARKSLYIEVIVPPSEALKQDGMRLNRFPVCRGNAGLTSGSYPWSVHRINLPVHPILNIRSKATRKLLNPHFGSTLSTADRSIIKHLPDGADVIAFLKDSLNALFARATGILGGPPARTFSLADVPTNNSDALILVDCVRYDLSCHTFVCDAFFVPLTRDLISRHETSFTRIVSKPEFVTLGVQKGGMAAWKQVIPAFVERCRTWEHGPNCEYVAQGRTPLSEELEKTPICNCGAGKDVDGMRKEAQWKVFAPYATRVAISPLFAVAYLERIGRDPDAYRCALCRGKGKPKLKACTGCRQIKYCSSECQTKDWKAHKAKCKAA